MLEFETDLLVNPIIGIDDNAMNEHYIAPWYTREVQSLSVSMICLLGLFLLAGCDLFSEEDATLTVNASFENILQLYVSDCDDEDWGSERLGGNVIPSGTGRSFSVSPGCYDLRAIKLRNGSFLARESIATGVQLKSGKTYNWTP